jgi:hypothetical protein
MADGPDEDWDVPELQEPLNVRCTDSDCENDLHCFKATRRMALDGAPHGECRSCHEQLVELDRTRRREPRDRRYLLDSLQKELIRHHFWHLFLDQTAMDKALRKGRGGLGEAAAKRLRSSVGKAKPFRDGTQTPLSGNAIYYAQHATASCCRTCIEYWHGIPKGHELTDDELSYLHSLIMEFIDERLPSLPDEPTLVPRRSR